MVPALIVVDMQNDFVAKVGYYDRKEKGEEPDTLATPSQERPFEARCSDLNELIKNVAGAMSCARDQGWPIAFPLAAYGHEFRDRPRFLLGEENAQREHYPCKPQTWGSRLIDPICNALHRVYNPSNEVIFHKHTLDAFHGTELQHFFMDRRVDTVFVVGVETHACILTTAQSASTAQFKSAIVRDCTWACKKDLAEAALEIFEEAFGSVTTLDVLRQG